MKKALSYALSEYDIRKIIPEPIPIIEYPELNQVNHIDDILHSGFCVILIDFKRSFGHWCCLNKVNKNTLEWFDSYAGLPDSELKYINPNVRLRLHEQYPKLSDLMLNSPYKNIRFLSHRLQRLSNKISTCGRFVCVRYMCRKIPLKKFREQLLSKKGKLGDLSADEKSVIITYPIIGK